MLGLEVQRDNKSTVDIRNVGNDEVRHFIGKFEKPLVKDFRYDNSTNVIQTAKMQNDLLIFIKEIECSHGCTISNVDEEQLYYLQTKGFDKKSAENILVDSFLC